MRDDLQKLGLIQRKSLTMKFPNVPEEYMSHFIRGCWDGDGSVYIGKDNRINASFVSGSKDFIERLVEELFKVGLHKYKRKFVARNILQNRRILYTNKILHKKSKYKCSKCGSMDETMYVTEDIFCSKCLPTTKKKGKKKDKKIYLLTIHKDRRSKSYSIKLNSIGNCRIFFHYLYDGTDESMYLKRKYDVFMKGYIQSYKKSKFSR